MSIPVEAKLLLEACEGDRGRARRIAEKARDTHARHLEALVGLGHGDTPHADTVTRDLDNAMRVVAALEANS